jgi:hypothetical protein
MALPAADQTLDHRLMDVLVLETEPGSADWTIDELTDRGHRVSRCHTPGRPAFPCRALEQQGACPLGNPGSMSRSRCSPTPRRGWRRARDGVACAATPRRVVLIPRRGRPRWSMLPAHFHRDPAAREPTSVLRDSDLRLRMFGLVSARMQATTQDTEGGE